MVSECEVCGKKGAPPYKCPLCLACQYCSVTCYKEHKQKCLSTVEEGEINQVNDILKGDDDFVDILKCDDEIIDWSKEYSAKILSSADPVLTVQKLRQSDTKFSRISKKILNIIPQ